ncbi:MAG: M15 family metallopeptidase, partial [Aquirufa sp.]
ARVADKIRDYCTTGKRRFASAREKALKCHHSNSIRMKPLDMGTKYDFFGDLAYPSKEQVFLASGQLSQKAYQNRLILREAMQAAGFMRIEFEWWHFNAFSRAEAKRRFPVVQ